MRIVSEISKNDLALGSQVVLGGSVIVNVSPAGEVRACWNRCKHQGGRLVLSEGATATCPHHGWKLDVGSMTYLNPIGAGPQNELTVVEGSGGQLSICESVRPEPWGSRASRQLLRNQELMVTFLVHASIEVKMGQTTLISDPWYQGPAFTRGWWLARTPPDDVWQRLVHADFIYISHSHSDHLNSSTLAELAIRKPQAKFIVPPFDDCVLRLRSLGFEQIHVAEFGEWTALNSQSRLMLLKDGKSRDDSGMILDYKGFRLLSTVDSSDLNGGLLPDDVDMLLMSYSGGAVDYPVCWSEMYSESEINQQIRRDRRQIVNRIIRTVTSTNSKLFVPFASDFTECHPSDAAIASSNWKNSAQLVAEVVSRQTHAKSWIPEPGATYDFATESVSNEGVFGHPPSHDFERWIKPIRAAMDFVPLQTADGLLEYFTWAGFHGDLTLDIIETDETFQTVLRQTLIDLQSLRAVHGEPNPENHYLRIRVRADVFRFVLMHALPWEEFAIGFQARFFRIPDVHRMDFWEHMQDGLPSTPPWDLS